MKQVELYAKVRYAVQIDAREALTFGRHLPQPARRFDRVRMAQRYLNAAAHSSKIPHVFFR